MKMPKVGDKVIVTKSINGFNPQYINEERIVVETYGDYFKVGPMMGYVWPSEDTWHCAGSAPFIEAATEPVSIASPRIIVLTGLMGAGKSTLAQHLVTHFRYNTVSFAEPLKEIVRKITPDGKIDKARDRGLLQFVGMYYRSIDVNHWVNIAKARIDALLAKGMSIVIDDARFDNEFDALKKLEATFIHVEATSLARENRLESRDGSINTGIAGHPSENEDLASEYADFFLFNGNDLELTTKRLLRALEVSAKQSATNSPKLTPSLVREALKDAPRAEKGPSEGSVTGHSSLSHRLLEAGGPFGYGGF